MNAFVDTTTVTPTAFLDVFSHHPDNDTIDHGDGTQTKIYRCSGDWFSVFVTQDDVTMIDADLNSEGCDQDDLIGCLVTNYQLKEDTIEQFFIDLRLVLMGFEDLHQIVAGQGWCDMNGTRHADFATVKAVNEGIMLAFKLHGWTDDDMYQHAG